MQNFFSACPALYPTISFGLRKTRGIRLGWKLVASCSMLTLSKLSISLTSAPVPLNLGSSSSSHMRVLFAGQIPKEYTYPEDIEDTFTVSMETGTVAVSDGASESFDSKAWAKLLVKGYVGEPQFNSDWVRNRLDEYNCSFDVSSLSWSRMAAYERGRFATLPLPYFNPR